MNFPYSSTSRKSASPFGLVCDMAPPVSQSNPPVRTEHTFGSDTCQYSCLRPGGDRSAGPWAAAYENAARTIAVRMQRRFAATSPTSPCFRTRESRRTWFAGSTPNCSRAARSGWSASTSPRRGRCQPSGSTRTCGAAPTTWSGPSASATRRTAWSGCTWY